MVPGLIAIAGLLAVLKGGRSQRDRYQQARRDHPSSRPAVETIDGMLYVGLRPATHDAA